MTCGQPVDLNPYIRRVRNSELLPWTGEIVEVVGLLLASRGPSRRRRGFLRSPDVRPAKRIRTQVVGFRDGHVLSMPLEEVDGIQLHDTHRGAPGGFRVASRAGPDRQGIRRLRRATGPQAEASARIRITRSTGPRRVRWTANISPNLSPPESVPSTP